MKKTHLDIVVVCDSLKIILLVWRYALAFEHDLLSFRAIPRKQQSIEKCRTTIVNKFETELFF